MHFSTIISVSAIVLAPCALAYGYDHSYGYEGIYKRSAMPYADALADPYAEAYADAYADAWADAYADAFADPEAWIYEDEPELLIGRRAAKGTPAAGKAPASGTKSSDDGWHTGTPSMPKGYYSPEINGRWRTDSLRCSDKTKECNGKIIT